MLRSEPDSSGIPFESARPNLHPKDPELIKAVMNPMMGPQRLHKDYIFKYIRETYEDVLKISEGFDLVVGGALCFFMPTLAEVKKIPWVSVTLSPILLWSAYDVPLIPQIPFLRDLLIKLGPRFSKFYFDTSLRFINNWASELHQLRRDLGLPPSKGLYRGMMDSPHLNLMLFSEHFAPPQLDWPQPFEQPGFVSFDGIEREISPELENFLNIGEAPILFTLGSTASENPGTLLEHFMKSSELLNERAIFVLGTQSYETFKSLNSSNLFFSDYIPYNKIMPRCKAIIHQGGIGTTAQALKSGHPSIIVAEVNDQPDNGVHLANTGAGEWVHASKITPQILANKIQRLVSNQERLKVSREISLKLAIEKPAFEAAKSILKLC